MFYKGYEIMLISFFPIALFLMGWCIVDILHQRIRKDFKILLIIGVILLTLLGVLIYYLWLKPNIKKGWFSI